MQYAVAIWTHSGWVSPDVWTWVDAPDPASAALSVMTLFGLRSALQVLVHSAPGVEAAVFSPVELDGL